MFVYRVSPRIYAKELTGEGSRLFGGRWNHRGVACIYTSCTRALAVLEYAVNVSVDEVPDDLMIVTCKVHTAQDVLQVAELPENWRSRSDFQNTRSFGTALLEKAKHLIIRIPSVVIPEEYNYIINPAHPDMKKVTIADVSPFSFDTRLKR